MNIFNSLKKYAEKWRETDCRPFSANEIAEVSSATVVESQYGYSVCFMMREGGMTFIPLDQNSSCALGSKIDLAKAELVTLSKSGEDDIYRVRV